MNIDPNILPLVVFAAVTLVLAGLPFFLGHRLIRRLNGRAAPDYRFDPLTVDDLPGAARRWFENHAPAMLACGLEPRGDYRLTPAPDETLARFFSSRDGRVFGSIEYRPGSWTYRRNYAFFSAFSDGTYLECGPIARPPGMPEPMPQLRLEFVPGADVRRLWEHHLQAIERLEEMGQRQCLSFAPSQVREVANYGHRLVGWDLAEKGLRPAPPVPQNELVA